MTDRKLLIDTNVFIGLEDQREVAPEFAELLQLCNQHSIHVFVHDAAFDDIGKAMRAALGQLSYVERRNILVESRFDEGIPGRLEDSPPSW